MAKNLSKEEMSDFHAALDKVIDQFFPGENWRSSLRDKLYSPDGSFCYMLEFIKYKKEE